MKKVIFCVNIPSPYRVDFFNELGKHSDLTVCYERRNSSERDNKWKGACASKYNEVMLDAKPVGVDRTIGFELCNYLRKHKSDILVFGNSFSPSGLLAIIWCRLHHREYYLESDGGFFKVDKFPKNLIKTFIRNGSIGYFETCKECIKSLEYVNYPEAQIVKYPFSSVRQSEIRKTAISNKDELKRELEISETKVLLSVGRFSYLAGYGKGYDVLLEVAEALDEDTGVYIVGDNPTEEFVRIKEARNLKNVHFVGFKEKNELAKYYSIANCFIILSRGDAWGLVVNEAMAFNLPVISSDKCNAGLEMIEDGRNGYVVSLDNPEEIAKKVKTIMKNGTEYYSESVYNTICRYTIETMVAAHLKAWNIEQ